MLIGCFPLIFIILTNRLNKPGRERHPKLSQTEKRTMPFSDTYVDVPTGKCGCGCQLALSPFGVEVGSRHLLVRLRCEACTGLIPHYFDRYTGSYQDSPALEVFIKVPDFPCPTGCQFMPLISRIEAGVRFLRVHFKCGVCQSRFSRYFDVDARGYVLVPKPLDRRRAHDAFYDSRYLTGWGRLRGQRKYVEDIMVRYTAPSDWPIEQAPDPTPA